MRYSPNLTWERGFSSLHLKSENTGSGTKPIFKFYLIQLFTYVMYYLLAFGAILKYPFWLEPSDLTRVTDAQSHKRRWTQHCVLNPLYHVQCKLEHLTSQNSISNFTDWCSIYFSLTLHQEINVESLKNNTSLTSQSNINENMTLLYFERGLSLIFSCYFHEDNLALAAILTTTHHTINHVDPLSPSRPPRWQFRSGQWILFHPPASILSPTSPPIVQCAAFIQTAMVEEHTIHFLVVVRASDSGTINFVCGHGNNC
jgi:hypothetical protein